MTFKLLSAACAFAESISSQTLTNTTPSPKVIEVWGGKLAVGKTVTAVVTNLSEWAKLGADHDPNKIVPFINGRHLAELYPTEIHLNQGTNPGTLSFRLAITDANKDTWIDLLGRPTNLSRQVTFSVGLETLNERFDTVYRYGSQKLRLTIISGPATSIALAVIIFVGITLFRLARNSDLIRDAGPPPTSRRMKPYNLGRSQMAFWFYLILSSYVAIWLITDNLESITPSLLALIGISAGTALGEALIDANKNDAEEQKQRTLASEKKNLEMDLASVDSQLAALNARGSSAQADIALKASLETQRNKKRQRLEEVNQNLEAFSSFSDEAVSKGFLRDVLSDGEDYSFHRFQIFAWTLVLGVIFMASVYERLQMPEFNATLLGLMGISGGTFLGFKFPEK